MHCNTCDNIKICPKFIAMSTPELLSYCKTKKKTLGISATKLSELSGVPIGTIESLFGKDKIDCKYETLRPILAVLLSLEPCGHLQETDPELLAEVNRLRTENNALKDRLLAADPQHREDIKQVKSEEHKKVEYLLANDKQKNKTITILGVLLFVAVAALVVSLGMDSIW